MNQSTILQSLGWALLNSLWQMAFLWVIYQLLTGSFTKVSSQKKALLATLFTCSGFAWFIYTFVNGLIHPVQLAGSWQGFISGNRVLELFGRILPVASLVYLGILMVPVYRFFRNLRYVQVIKKEGLKKIDAGLRVFVNYSAVAMGISRQVRVWLSEIIQTPVTIGFLKPMILIPVSVVNNLSPQQVESIILHELVHIRRYDYLVNLVINLIRTIMYFNPFVSLFVRVIEKERENSCDDQVVQFIEQPSEYAEALLMLEKNASTPMLVAAAGNNFHLLNRIELIMGIKKKAGFPVRQLVVSMSVLFIAAMVNFFISVSGNKSTPGYYTINTGLNPYHFYGNRQVSNTPVRNMQAKKVLNSPMKPVAALAETEMSFTPENEFAYPIERISAKPLENIHQVNYITEVIPELSLMEEQNVKNAVAATRDVLEKKEWKELEKSYADAFTPAEKNVLYGQFLSEVEQIDWNKLENKMRVSYNDLNWEKIKVQLEQSFAQMHFDSLQHEVNVQLNELDQIETFLKENKLKYFPDSDIDLSRVAARQKAARAIMEKIKTERSKKTIKL